MPVLRRYLRWTSLALLAIFAPFLALVVYLSERLRMRTKPAVHAGRSTLILPPKAKSAERRASLGPMPSCGAVILPFRSRSAVPAAPQDNDARTGSL